MNFEYLAYGLVALLFLVLIPWLWNSFARYLEVKKAHKRMDREFRELNEYEQVRDLNEHRIINYDSVQ